MQPLARSALAPSAMMAVLLTACGATSDQQLAMCQGVAKQLAGAGIASWERIDQSDRGRSRQVQIAYRTVDDGSGTIDCAFPIDENGTVATGPNRVRIDGREIGRKELLVAGTAATKEIIAGTAAKTAEATREFAKDAGEKSRELANQAGDVARDVASEAGSVARDVAVKARETASEVGKTLQQKLEQ